MPRENKNQNRSYLENDLLLDDGWIVNLRVLKPPLKNNHKQEEASPYVLNLKPKAKKTERVLGLPNLVNLKESSLKREPESISERINQGPRPLKRKAEIKKPRNDFWSLFQKIKKRRGGALTWQSPWPSRLRRGSPLAAAKAGKKRQTVLRAINQKLVLDDPFALFPRNLPAPAFVSKTVFSAKKSLAVFVLIALFFSSLISTTAFFQKAFHLKDDVLKTANTAYAKLTDAQDYLSREDYDLASSSFSQASRDFAYALSETQNLGKVMMQIMEFMPLSTKLKQGPKILKVGEHLALTGEYLALTIKPFLKIDPIYDPLSSSEDRELTLTEAIVESQNNLEIALSNLEGAENELNQIDSSKLDQETREKIEFLGENINLVNASLHKLFSFTGDFLKILGHDQPKRYLLLFQNNNEIRATGGFIGSYGILDLDQGQIKNLEIDGIYNVDGQLLSKITPPEPIRFTNDRWHARDANWFPDFPASARKVAWFLERAGKPSVDGVIALTPEVIVELLKLIDPIEMSKYETTIDPDNFVIQAQREVELEYDREENRPKQFLSDLAPEILERTLSTEKPQWLSLLSIFSKELERKNLLFYFFDEDLEKFVLEQGWGGEIKNASADYFSVVNSNINGGKTDGMIRETIELETIISDDGSIVNEIKITRHHTGDYAWPSINNINYLRLYVPEGSTLLEAHGFDRVNIPPLTYAEMQYEKDPLLSEIRETSKIDQDSNTVITREFGKTCFGNWISVKPQEKRTVSFKYQLPFKVESRILDEIDKYSLLVQKQAGSFGSEFNFKLNLPPKLKPIWQYPEKVQINQEGNLTWSTVLDTDKYFGVALEKK